MSEQAVDPTITGTRRGADVSRDEVTDKQLANDPMHKRMVGVALHGNTPFDVPFISHIEGNLYVGGCETGLVLPSMFKHVVSLYPWERYRVKHDLSSFLEVRLFDSSELPHSAILSIAEWASQCLETGPTLIHCQAGLNRSPLITAVVMSIYDGFTPEAAIALLREKRSPAVLCNPYFEEWLKELE